MEGNILKINRVIEKPKNPRSNLGIVPVYIFDHRIFEALEETKPGISNELQLTDAIQRLVEWNYNVYAVQLSPNEIRLDIGNPIAYWEALKFSYEIYCR
jgi:UTP-glucose-1-phosphate uridylyltransferase